jgi:uncharacterized protein (TIGR03083 family)
MNLEQHFRQQMTAFAHTVKDLEPGLTVPTCPEWQARDLVGHMGQAPRWASGIVRTRQPDAYPDPLAAEPGPPGQWARWLDEGVQELADAIAGTGLDTPVWTPIGERPAAFWLRRMLCDLTVHRADAARTAGTVYEVDPELAAEVITEGLEFLNGIKASPGDGATLLLVAEAGETWLITRTPSGSIFTGAGTDADVVATGPAGDLMLMLTRRIPVDDVKITGDRAVLQQWLADLPI